MAGLARINVASEMAACVRSIGGEVLDETLPPNRPFLNADYRFSTDRIIVELKSVETQVASDEAFIERASAMHAKWIAEGRIPRPRQAPRADGTVELSTADLPHECTVELLSIVCGRAFFEHLKKASKQIKETARQIGPHDAKGLLLLCIDEDTGVSLRVIWHVIGQLMLLHGSRYSGIASVVVFSANYAVGLPGQPPIRPWMLLTGPDRTPVETAFIQKLGRAWQARMKALGGPAVLLMGDGTPIADALLGENFLPIKQG